MYRSSNGSISNLRKIFRYQYFIYSFDIEEYDACNFTDFFQSITADKAEEVQIELCIIYRGLKHQHF